MDLIEINPPLIVWLNVPVVATARALGLPDILVYRLASAGILLACIALTARFLRHLLPQAEKQRARVLLLLTVVLFLLPGSNFGQREHLMLALIVPYLALAVARVSGPTPRHREAVGVGALAGVGFALKPHFLLLLVALEGYLLFRRRDRTSRVRPEALSAAAVLLSYGAAVLLITPEYLPMVRLLGSSYLGFLYDPFLHLLGTAPGAILCYFGVLAWVALRKHLRIPASGEVLVVAILAALAAGAAQQKGLSYHFYPASALALVLLGMLFAESWGGLTSPAERLYQVLAGGVLAAAVVGAAAEGALDLTRPDRTSGKPELAPLSRIIRQRAPGQPIFIMSYHIGSAFPLVNYSGAVLGSRFHHLWVLASDYLDRMKAPEPLRYRAPAEMPASERFLNEAVLADLKRYQPRLLIVLRHGRDDPGNGYRRFDYIRYFGRDPRLAGILGQYQELDTVGDYVVYERVSGAAARTRPPPASRPGTQDLQRRRADVLGLGIGSPMFLMKLGIFLLTVTALAAVQLAGRSRARGTAAPGAGGM